MNQLKILARAPRRTIEQAEFVVIELDTSESFLPFVSATITPRTLANGEWMWGHYFETLAEAMDHFRERVAA